RLRRVRNDQICDQLRIVREVSNDPRYRERMRCGVARAIVRLAFISLHTADPHHFPDWIGGSEVATGYALRDHDRFGLRQYAGSAPLEERQPDHLKEIRIDYCNRLLKGPVPNRRGHLFRKHVRHRFDLRNLVCDGGQHRKWAHRRPEDYFPKRRRVVPGRLEPIQVLRTGNPIVVRELIADEEEDEDGARQRHRQAHHIDEAVELVADESAQRHSKVMREHAATRSAARAPGWPWPGAACSRTPWPRRSGAP